MSLWGRFIQTLCPYGDTFLLSLQGHFVWTLFCFLSCLRPFCLTRTRCHLEDVFAGWYSGVRIRIRLRLKSGQRWGGLKKKKQLFNVKLALAKEVQSQDTGCRLSKWFCCGLVWGQWPQWPQWPLPQNFSVLWCRADSKPSIWGRSLSTTMTCIFDQFILFSVQFDQKKHPVASRVKFFTHVCHLLRKRP